MLIFIFHRCLQGEQEPLIARKKEKERASPELALAFLEGRGIKLRVDADSIAKLFIYNKEVKAMSTPHVLPKIVNIECVILDPWDGEWEVE